MAKPLLPDDLWDVVKSALPAEQPKPKGGRPRIPPSCSNTVTSGNSSPHRVADTNSHPVPFPYGIADAEG